MHKRAKRLPLELTLSFRELPSARPWQTARTVNISETGVLFRPSAVKRELSIGTPLEFVLVLSPGSGAADDLETGVAHCAGRIVREDPTSGTGIVATIDQYQLTRVPSISSHSRGIGASVESAADSVVGPVRPEFAIPDFEIASRLDVPVLITAGARSMRESVARLIHRKGIRGLSPFVHFRCDSVRPGSDEFVAWHRILAQANGGTLFLDEIGELPSRLQRDLFEVLNLRRTDVRIIASASKPLQDPITNGAFQQDLFYRINVIHLDCEPVHADETLAYC